MFQFCEHHLYNKPHCVCSGRALEDLLSILKEAIIVALQGDKQELRDLRWLRFLKQQDLIDMVLCKEDLNNTSPEFAKLSGDQQNQIMALRGLLGHNVLEACLQKR